MRVRRYFVALALGLVMFDLGGVPAKATPPDIVELFVDREVPALGVTNLCGLAVVRHDVFRLRVITFYDGQGEPTRELQLVHGTSDFIANGQSVNGVWRSVQSAAFHDDGSATFVIAGVTFLVVLPGVGPAWGGAGNLRIAFNDEGNILSYENNGMDVQHPAICTALAP